ncbi:MAG: hypothetical protein HY255_02535, partial [Betaproteobacteria bacterium]|nr:hypothetical protein [Betaproteobacteria bacterium]
MNVAMRKSIVKDNEGKCCDAVIRILEEREGGDRTAISYPEHEQHSAPVEIVCTIGKTRYALEHTKLQSYPDQLQDGVHFCNALEVLEGKLSGRLPHIGWFMLIIPTGVFDGLSYDDAIHIRNNLESWIIRVAPTMTLSARGFAVLKDVVGGVPFDVRLQAMQCSQELLGNLRIARSAPPNIDDLRLDEIGKTLAKKLPKLKIWSEQGVQTVLVLETEDIALANHGKTLDGLKHHLPLQGHFPDYIFFVYAIGSQWIVQTLAVNGRFPEDGLQWPQYRQFDQ